MSEGHTHELPKTLGEFLKDSPKNWGRWGPDDELGCLNFLTNEEVLRGVRAVKQGKVFTTGEKMGNPQGDPIFPSRTPAFRVNVMDKSYFRAGRAPKYPGEVEYSDDYVTMFLQGTTQIDALGHVWFDDQMWNGYHADNSIGGMSKASILPIAEKGIVGRGVLLDMARYKGKFSLDKEDTLNLDDLKGCAEKQGVKIEKHDILCLRIGFLQNLWIQGKEVFYKDFNEPGMVYSPELVKWFHEMEIACLSTDTIGNECTINPGNGMMIPLHGALMRNLGIVFNEICNFEALADDCHKDGQWDFLYTGGPIKVVDGCGAPINPVIIK